MLHTTLFQRSFPNPVLLASGILGVTKASLDFVVKHGAGGAVIKSISLEERTGHHAPNMHAVPGGFLNAVGYSNPGVDEAAKEFSQLDHIPAPIVASLIGRNADEFAEVVRRLLPGTFSAVEIVLSCPHTPGYGTLAGQGTPAATEEITRAVRQQTDLPLWVKVSPQSEPLADVARAAEVAGADAITAINTAGPGMYIDVYSGSPVLSFGMGGLSGPALHPLAVRCVYDIAQAVKIPVIGVGGISTGRDAVEMMMAGASLVQIGTAVYYRGVDVFQRVTEEMTEILRELGVQHVSDVIGKTIKMMKQ